MRRLPLLLTVMALGPGLCAQSPLFNDGPAFGGSRVFGEGLSPFTNPARFSLARPNATRPGTYVTYIDGGQEATDFQKALDALRHDSGLEGALSRMGESRWGTRTKAVGLSLLQDNGHFSLTRESATALWATADLNPNHLGTGIADNTSNLEARRYVVERAVYGMASTERNTSMGLSLRVERWTTGSRMHLLNPAQDQFPMSGPAFDPYAFEIASERTTAITLDSGFTTHLGAGLELGVMVDRLFGKKIGDVDEKPQVRAGLRVELGQIGHLVLESDLNKSARMPFPEKQRTTSASLQFQVNPSVQLTLGAEKKDLGLQSTTRTGISIRIQTPMLMVGAGFQFGQDKPLRGGTLRLY